jgi:flagellar FliJ protein
MTFRFRFETVLKVKNQQEETCRLELAREEQRLVAKNAEIETLLITREHQVSQFLAASNGQIDLKYLASCSSYLSALRERQTCCQRQRDEICEDVSMARRALVEARKECKVMEQLKERDHQQYVKDELSKEQKILDEVGINTHRRNRG